MQAPATKVGRYIKDPIYGDIPISPLLSKFIDTLQFQRLRNLKQLGPASYVWPGASHTRFEHSLGVAYLSRLMAQHLQKVQPELNISDRDIDCVEIAGLCHDLGHGPWSHMWDKVFLPRVLTGGQTWSHEDGSEMMLDALLNENDIPDITTADADFIKALIAGDANLCSADEKPFFFDIVANKRNGLDVDKFDYIQRDSHMIGDPIHLSLPRIINSARVLDDQIVYDIKTADQIYEICATRFKLYKTIYSHKAALAIATMFVDAILAAEPFLHYSEHTFDPALFLNLTECSIVARIQSSTEPELKASRDILRRIHTRDIYKCVDYKIIDWQMRHVFKNHITPENIVKEANKLSPPPDESDSLTADDVHVRFSTMHYGMMEKNPLDFIQFYSKRNPGISAKAGRGDYSTLTPEHFAEVALRVFTKKPQFFGRVQAGYRSILAQLEERAVPGSSTEKTSGIESETPSPAKRPCTAHTGAEPPEKRAKASPFSNNQFTTVDLTFALPAKTRTLTPSTRVLRSNSKRMGNGQGVKE